MAASAVAGRVVGPLATMPTRIMSTGIMSTGIMAGAIVGAVARHHRVALRLD